MEIRHILAQHFRPLGILPHQAAYLAVVRMYAGQLPEAVVYELLQLPEAFIVLCYLVLQFVQFSTSAAVFALMISCAVSFCASLSMNMSIRSSS